ARARYAGCHVNRLLRTATIAASRQAKYMQSRPKMTAPAIKYEDKRPRHVAASQCSAVGAPNSAEQVRLADLLYPLALAHSSGRSAFFQSGMAEIFFSRSSTSASFCRPGTRSDGKPGSTSTLASALANVSRDMA